MFAVKIRNIADISNKRRKINKSSISAFFFISDQELASTQTLETAFLERIRKVQKSKYETDLLQIVDCFIDGYGTVNSTVSIFLLIVEYLFIKILSKLFLYKSKVFSTNKFAIFNTCAKINSEFFRNMQNLV